MVRQYADKINRMVKLAEIRKEKKITLENAAGAIGINPVSLSRYERGIREVPFNVYERYAEFLGFEIRELLK